VRSVLFFHPLRARTYPVDFGRFVVASLLSTRFQTPVSKKNTNPTYPAKDATFDFPIYLSLADRLGAVELVVWDKDMLLKKDYLGEVALPLEDWFAEGRAIGFDDAANQVCFFPFPPWSSEISDALHRRKADQRQSGFYEGWDNCYRKSSGEAWFRLTTAGTGPRRLCRNPLRPHQTLATQPCICSSCSCVLFGLLMRWRLNSFPKTEGIGTIRSHETGPEFEDDGGISSDDDADQYVTDDDDDVAGPPIPTSESQEVDMKQTPPLIAVSPGTSSTSTASSVTKTPVSSKPCTPGLIPKIFPSRSNTGSSATSVSVPTLESGAPLAQQRTSGTSSTTKKPKFGKSWARKKSDYNFNAGNDIMGIVMLEVQGATDLPRLKNS
jgi:phosphatidylserine decarboxylase